MNALLNWLSSLKAKDVMTKPVVVLHVYDPLLKTAGTLYRAHVSGAPVVDDQGRCVGVLSATDIVHFDSWISGSEAEGMGGQEFKPQPDEVVGRLMTRDLVSVSEDTTLDVVVKCMVEAKIHRVIVLDRDKRVKGVVSTSDVLGILNRAAAGEASSGRAETMPQGD